MMMTLSDMIKNSAQNVDNFIFFINSEGEEVKVSYKEILEDSLKMLGYLQSKGVKAKSELVFQLDDNKSFISMFWAAVLGGIISVPIGTEDTKLNKLRFFNVLDKLNDAYVVCTKRYYEKLVEFSIKYKINIELLKDKFIYIEDAVSYIGKGSIYESKPSDIAIIQFSSGSTGNPKGVSLTNKNIIANIEGITESTHMSKDDKYIYWVSLIHNMGLIACHLTATSLALEQIIIHSNSFIRNPQILLQKISEHKSTIYMSPNFGFRYILDYIYKNDFEVYDLSSIRILLNAGEPINVNLCNEFVEKMSKFKLKENTIYPAYGLSEATVGVAFTDPEEKMKVVYVDRRNLEIGKKVEYSSETEGNYITGLVEVGSAIKNTKIRITDLDNKLVDENVLGFVDIKGLNVTDGYYNMKTINKNVFKEDGWFCTEDLGFIKDNKLIVVGRYNDLIIINGENYYVSDLENIVREVAGINIKEGEAIVNEIKKENNQNEVVVFIKYSGEQSDFEEVKKNVKIGMNMSTGIIIKDVIPVKDIPRTVSGKVERYKIVQQFINGEFDNKIERKSLVKTLKEIEEEALIGDIGKNILSVVNKEIKGQEIDIYTNLFEVGVNSIILQKISYELLKKYKYKVKPADFYYNTTINELSKRICNGNKDKKVNNLSRNLIYNDNDDIAIVGISLNIGDIRNLNDYWKCIAESKSKVREFPESRRKDLIDFLDRKISNVDKVKYHKACYLDDICYFDYKYFNILPNEAISMIPAQRMFLQEAVKSVEDSGNSLSKIKGSRTGVFIGYIGDTDGYKYQQILDESSNLKSPTGILSSNIAGRVSYVMDLRGPSLMVNSACTSSIVALDLACNSIKQGNCEQAIVGGVRLNSIPIDDGYRSGLESENYVARPFDLYSNGMVEGEGIVSIFIKPLNKAKKDKNNIYAVIKSTAINHNGNSVDFSNPNPKSITEVALEALQKANVKPDTISYVEAQGSGTVIGDAIEFTALNNAYSAINNEKCAIGSVEGNIGHLFEASGLANIVKCCLMMKNKKIPSVTNFKEPSEYINLNESIFYIPKSLSDWNPRGGIRRCAVNNFGLSGSNGHVILEEFIEDNNKEMRKEESINLFTLTAKNKVSIGNMLNKFIKYLENNRNENIGDICYTSSACRDHHEYRIAIICSSVDDLLNKLKEFKYKSNREQNIFWGIHNVISETAKKNKLTDLTKKDVDKLSQKASNLISQINSENILEKLAMIAQVYTRGANLDWTNIYKNRNIISIPTYEFNKLKCWPIIENKIYEGEVVCKV